MDIAKKYFQRKFFDEAACLAYGFVPCENALVYRAPLLNGAFTLVLTLANGEIESRAIENATDEEFILYRVEEANGAFVGQIREQAEEVFEKIAARCSKTQVFSCPQTLSLLAHATNIYNTRAEYLWEKFPDNAVLRRDDNQKWYAAVLTTNKSRFFAGAEGNAEVIDLRGDPQEILTLLDNQTYFPAYHMNKKHWYTILLNGSVSDEELFARLKKSYELAK